MKKLKISAHSGIRIKNLIILVGMLMIKFVYAHFIVLKIIINVSFSSMSLNQNIS